MSACMKGFVVEIPGKKYDWVAIDVKSLTYYFPAHKEKGLKYLRNLNLFHGYDEIYLPKRLEDEIPEEYMQLEFLHFFPDSLLKYGERRRDRLSDILVDLLNCFDLPELLWEFCLEVPLRLYSYWSIANELEATLIFPRASFLQRGTLGLLFPREPYNESIRNDFATWYFSHIPDSVSPIIKYNNEIPQRLYNEILASNQRKELSLLREKAMDIFQKGRDIYKVIKTELPRINNGFRNFLQRNFKSIGATSSSISIACITENYLTLLPTVFTVPELLKEFQKVVCHKKFDSLFNYEPFFDNLPDFKIIQDEQEYSSKYGSIFVSRIPEHNFKILIQNGGIHRADQEDRSFPHTVLYKHIFLRQHRQINDDYESAYE